MTRTRFVSAGITLTAALIAFCIAYTAAADDGTVYGKPLSGSDTTRISVLMADPGKYVGQTVRVEGLITSVCEKRGCWMTLASDQAPQDLRIKVDDGAIVFPIKARGKYAIAEGLFTRIAMTMEETLAYKKHIAEEQNEAFDPGKVTEPLTYYQIKATGAVIR